MNWRYTLILLVCVISYYLGTCDNGANGNISICSKVDSSMVFNQQDFTKRSNGDVASSLFCAGKTETCHLEKNDSLRIKLKRLSRISYIGIHLNATSGIKGKLLVNVTRDMASDSSVDVRCQNYTEDETWEYFCCNCKGNGTLINAVKITAKSAIILNLKLTPNASWMFVIDKDCGNQSLYNTGDITNCQPQTCKRPDDIANGKWQYLSNSSSYNEVQYSCNDLAVMYNGVGNATCNFAKNEWDDVPTCSIPTTTTTTTTTTPSSTTTIEITNTTNSSLSEHNTAMNFMMKFGLLVVLGLVILAIITVIFVSLRKTRTCFRGEAESAYENQEPLYERVFKKRSKPNSEPIYENTAHSSLVNNEEPLYSDASLIFPSSVTPQSSQTANELVYCELNFGTSTGAGAIVKPKSEETLYASIAKS